MAYETKVILTLAADRILMCRTVEEAYEVIRKAASVEGVALPVYEDAIKELAKFER